MNEDIARPETVDEWAAAHALLAGKYRVERVLGRGGLGLVMAATHVALERPVAVKLLLPRARQDAKALERFAQEARAAAQLRSEHVVRVHDIGGLDDGTPFIVMEHLDGADLATHLDAHGALSIAEATTYVLQACDAIAEAHERGIVHRDLKPANLFLTRRRDGRPCIKVLDFGISRVRGRIAPGAPLTDESIILGSPGYMSPEQMRSSRDVDERADVWALGAILFELLTGKPAFEGETLDDIYRKILLGEAPRVRALRAGVPEALARTVARCLERRPEDRFASVTELARALAEHAPPDAVRAPPPSSSEPLPVARTISGSARFLLRPSSSMRRRHASWTAIPVAAVLCAALAYLAPAARTAATGRAEEARATRAIMLSAEHRARTRLVIPPATPAPRRPIPRPVAPKLPDAHPEFGTRR